MSLQAASSKANAPPLPFPPQNWLYAMNGAGKPKYWYPHLYNHLNCVYGNKQEPWMNGTGYKEFYLFKTGRSCCDMWYPTNNDCPLPEGTLAVACDIEDNPFYGELIGNYFYPNAALGSCGYTDVTSQPGWGRRVMPSIISSKLELNVVIGSIPV